jgi:hypothetical protein
MTITKTRTRILVILLALMVALSMWVMLDTDEAHAAPVQLTVTVPGATDGSVALYVYDAVNDDWDWETSNSVNASGAAILSYDSALNGKQATLQYNTWDNTKIASQTLGGWFGSIYSGDAKFTKFPLAAGARSFALAKAATLVVTVTPKTNTAGTVSTYVEAVRVGKTKAGGPSLYYDAYVSVDATTGKATFSSLQPGATYLFQANGSHKVGTQNVSYVPVWYGGYIGSSVYGTPKNLKTKKAPAAGKTAAVGKIALKTYKGGAKGKATKGRWLSFTNPATGVSSSVSVDATTGTYTVDLPAGVYIAQDNGYVKAFTVGKKKVSVNFPTKSLPSISIGNITTNVTGAVKKGSKVKAKATAWNSGYKVKGVKFSYIWTDGKKILGKKSTYKVSKAVAKKTGTLYVITIANYKKHSSTYRIDKVK